MTRNALELPGYEAQYLRASPPVFSRLKKDTVMGKMTSVLEVVSLERMQLPNMKDVLKLIRMQAQHAYPLVRDMGSQELEAASQSPLTCSLLRCDEEGLVALFSQQKETRKLLTESEHPYVRMGKHSRGAARAAIYRMPMGAVTQLYCESELPPTLPELLYLSQTDEVVNMGLGFMGEFLIGRSPKGLAKEATIRKHIRDAVKISGTFVCLGDIHRSIKQIVDGMYEVLQTPQDIDRLPETDQQRALDFCATFAVNNFLKEHTRRAVKEKYSAVNERDSGYVM